MTEAADRVLTHHLHVIASRLGDEFAGIFSARTIDRYLQESADQFTDAPIRDFIR